MSHPPSVDALARELADTGLPHPLLVDAARAAIGAGDPASARLRAEEVSAALLRPVINATGVLLHTNLGRAPLDPPTVALKAGGTRYTNLEFDLGSGRRGSRSVHAAGLLARAAGAEAALVVNNNAAAVMLVLAALARDRAVVVSRGELVEIGGGFRVPEVMEQSGCRLVEVGTTNRTRLADYAAAVAAVAGAVAVAGATGAAAVVGAAEHGPGHSGGEVALILKVHQSNYRIVGFTESVEIGPLAKLGPPVLVDLGSGLLDAATPWLGGGPPSWLAGEPAVRQTLQAGAALVTFSGDKLLGGPQAGVIAGRADLVEACRRHPLSRALRPGGLVLRALQETAMAYLRRDGDAIAFWRMAATPVEELRARAAGLGAGTVVDTVAVAGGGSVPGQDVPSAGVALDGDHAAALRAHDPPIIARVHEGMTVCDLRAVDPADDPVLAKALTETAGGGAGAPAASEEAAAPVAERKNVGAPAEAATPPNNCE